MLLWEKMSGIKLIVCDIEGCLTPGKGLPLNLAALALLRDYNAKSRANRKFPPLSICTGRSQPYVEATLQAIGGFMPAVCKIFSAFRLCRKKTPPLDAPALKGEAFEFPAVFLLFASDLFANCRSASHFLSCLKAAGSEGTEVFERSSKGRSVLRRKF